MGRVFPILLTGVLWGCNSQPPAVVFLADPQEVQAAISRGEQDKTGALRNRIQLYKDLGVVLTGTKHDVEFEIVNSSDVDWVFHDMVKSCRCVVAEPIPALIPKNGSAQLRMTIDAGPNSGDSDRMIRLNYTNCPGQIVLNVKTRMRTPLYVSCRELRFPPSTPGTTIQATARVENWSDTKWESLEVQPSVDWMQATATPTTTWVLADEVPGLRMQQMWDLTVTANPPHEVTGSIVQSVALRAIGASEVKTLPVVGERPHPVASRPPALIVSRGMQPEAASAGRMLVATLTLSATSSAKSFIILSTTGTRLDGCEISFEQVSDTEARVEVVSPSTRSGGISGHVVVKFAHGLPDLVIPVAGGV